MAIFSRFSSRFEPKGEAAATEAISTALAKVLSVLGQALESLEGTGEVEQQVSIMTEELHEALEVKDYLVIKKRAQRLSIPPQRGGGARLPEPQQAPPPAPVEAPPTMSGSASAQDLIRELVPDLVPMARGLGIHGSAAALNKLMAESATTPADALMEPLHGQLTILKEGIEQAQKARDVLQSGLVELSESLEQLAGQSPNQRGQLRQVVHRLRSTESLKTISELREQLLEQTDDLIESTRSREKEILHLKQNAQHTADRASELEEALQAAESDAQTDPLTGLGNRRALERHLKKLLRVTEPMGILQVDLDYFKGVNDTYGHEVGDRALCSVASSFNTVLVEPERAFRIGGDEFLLFLRRSSKEDICGVGDRLNELMRANPISAGGDEIVVTLSIGGTTWNSDDVFSACQAKADEALYEAKEHGRNCTRYFS